MRTSKNRIRKVGDMSELGSFLYGASSVFIIYVIAYQLYSVYYTPGNSTLYSSPISQMLFPGAKNPLYPRWGYDKVGMIKGDPTKYGAASFWPKSGKGFVPDPAGSGGPSPSGGMRDFKVSTKVELRDGYDPLPVLRDVYDQDPEIPKPTVTEVGWWGM